MSYAVPVTPGEKRRPAVVTAAGYLLYLVAVILVIRALLPLTSIGKVSDALRQAYASSTKPTPDQVASVYQVVAILSVVLTVILAIGAAVLASLDLRGRQVARIITWVVAGLGVLCLGCGVGGSSFSSRYSGTSSSGGVDSKTVNDLVSKAVPSWLEPVSLTLTVIGLLALIMVIILLALPASSAFFRKPAAQGQPGGVDPAYPSLPYPTVPGTGTGAPPTGTPPAPPAGTVPPAGTMPPADQPPAPPADQPPVQ